MCYKTAKLNGKKTGKIFVLRRKKFGKIDSRRQSLKKFSLKKVLFGLKFVDGALLHLGTFNSSLGNPIWGTTQCTILKQF
jgi:hypothetical protein